MAKKTPRARPRDTGATKLAPRSNPRGVNTGRKTLAPWTPERKAQLVELFRTSGRLGDAARSLGSSRRHIQRLRDDDEAFDQALTDAWEDFKEWTIAQVQRHAWEGLDQPVYQGGIQVGTKREHNTRMMELEAKRVVPEYRDSHRVEHSAETPIMIPVAYIPGQAPPAKPEDDDDDDA